MLVLVGIWVACCFLWVWVGVCAVVCCLRYVGGLMLWFACLLRVALLCAECVVAVWVGCFGGFFRFSGWLCGGKLCLASKVVLGDWLGSLFVVVDMFVYCSYRCWWLV